MNLYDMNSKKVMVFDGGMGTYIQSLSLKESAWGDFQNINEFLCIIAPEIITKIHKSYLDAGADIIETNTFGANKIVLGEYGYEEYAAELNKAAVKCAKNAINGMKDKFIALSIGPGSKLPTLNQISYDELYEAYYEQTKAAYTEGIDLVIIETCQDLLQIKAAVNAAKDIDNNLPIIVSFTVEENGSLLTGTDINTICTVLSGYDIFALGINCGFGPDKIGGAIKELAESWSGRLYLSSNAGMPEFIDNKITYSMSPETFSQKSFELAKTHGVNIIGGCCGTDNTHIKALYDKVKELPASFRQKSAIPQSGKVASAFNAISLRQKPAPTIIGERANATGSKAFRELIKANDYQGMAQTAKEQTDNAHIIDLSVAYAGRDEIKDMLSVVEILNSELISPIMIDSTNVQVMEEALKKVTGKPVLNSVNFEDGGKKLHKIFSLIKKYPAAVVGLTIDENGMAQTKEHKLQVAQRIYNTWVYEYGYNPEDLIIDFLTFSVASGEDSRLAAKQTIDAIREFKTAHPDVNTTLGVSNVSFGLSGSGRTILNAVFLDMAVKAGLDTAIVNAAKVLPISSLTDEELLICQAVLNGEDGAIDRFIEYFSDYTPQNNEDVKTKLTNEERLKNKVIKGDKTELEPLITDILTRKNAASLLNEILLPAMGELGELFGQGKVLLPFVLKSAEVMKSASDILTPYLQNNSGKNKGTVVLATVKGDVHDIGKNLVDIILSGNGYRVINLGTKVSAEDIVNAVKEHKADAVGMSGLLVRSVEIMKENIEIFKNAGLVDIPIMLGGAALSREYVASKCSPIIPGRIYYCKDAFDNIGALNGSIPPTMEHITQIKQMKDIKAAPFKADIITPFVGSSEPIKTSLEEILTYFNKKTLFASRWKYEDDDMLDKMLNEINNLNLDEIACIYGYFDVKAEGSSLYINDVKFAEFPIFGDKSLADYYNIDGRAVLPLQIVTLGKKAVEFTQKLYKSGEYQKYFLYHGLFVELTEAFAEYTQKKLDFKMKIDGETVPVTKTLRFSFGYPYCPDLSGNKAICSLLNAERIGVDILETFQMTPEYTTCAMISWHPEGKY